VKILRLIVLSMMWLQNEQFLEGRNYDSSPNKPKEEKKNSSSDSVIVMYTTLKSALHFLS